jgi:hypothetical protein
MVTARSRRCSSLRWPLPKSLATTFPWSACARFLLPALSESMIISTWLQQPSISSSSVVTRFTQSFVALSTSRGIFLLNLASRSMKRVSRCAARLVSFDACSCCCVMMASMPSSSALIWDRWAAPSFARIISTASLYSGAMVESPGAARQRRSLPGCERRAGVTNTEVTGVC